MLVRICRIVFSNLFLFFAVIPCLMAVSCDTAVGADKKDASMKTIGDFAPDYSVQFGNSNGREISIVAGEKGIWIWRFQCGSREIKPGGSIELFCEVPKFWLAVCEQKDSPELPGYVQVQGSNGVEAKLVSIANNWKSLSLTKVFLPNGLRSGQEITVTVGTPSEPTYAIAHKYKYAPVTWRVDYEGNGGIHPVWPSMVVHVVPGAPAKLSIVIPSTIKEGEKFSVRGRFEDKSSNIGAYTDSKVTLKLIDDKDRAVDGAVKSVTAGKDGIFSSDGWKISKPGVYRVHAQCEGMDPAWSNPAEVERNPQCMILWGDGHNHTLWADGVGTFDDNISYARDEAFLDIFALSPHVNHATGYSPVVDKPGSDWTKLGPDLGKHIRDAYEPGRFVTILAYEHTPQVDTVGPNGDLVVFSPSDRWQDMPVAFEYTDLKDMAKKHSCIAIPHVGGGNPPWPGLPVDPAVTPLVEIASMHGHFECYVQEGLQLGHKFGFVGMADGHFGMPGYDNWALHGRTPQLKERNYAVQSALTAFMMKDFTREGVIDAMRNRATYATTGQRILLDFAVNGSPVGSEIVSGTAPEIKITIHGTAPIAVVDIIRGDRRLHRAYGGGMKDLVINYTDDAPVKGENWYYVRVIQEDFSIAWLSPIWVDYTGSAGVEKSKQTLPMWSDGPHWPYPSPDTCKPEYSLRLENILKKRGLTDRFVDVKQIGVFTEPRGRFAFFRAVDAMRDNLPVHIQLYVDFEDDRLFIADGYSIYGQYLF